MTGGSRWTKIGVNCLAIRNAPGGVKSFLLNTLRKMEPREGERVFLLVSPDATPSFSDLANRAGWTIVLSPLSSRRASVRVLLDQLWVPRVAARLGLDCIWSPTEIATLATPKPQVITFQAGLAVPAIQQMDKRGPETIGLLRRFFFRMFVGPSLARSKSAVAVSHFMAREIRRSFPASAGKIRVVYEGGADHGVTNEPKDFQSTRPMVLFVGNLYPYKGVDLLIRAFAQARRHGDFDDVELVVAGREMRKGEKNRLIQVAQAEKISRCLRFTGAVQNRELKTLYDSARVLTFPSLIESFGLPPLEAMARGTPVLASDRMSVPEICGDGAWIVDPENTGRFAAALHALVTDDQQWRTFQQRGLSRAREFSWEKTASEIMQLLRRTTDGSGVA